MGAFFAKEVMEAAVQVEKNGQLFYQKMSQQALAPGARKVFSYLADKEKEHILDLERLAGRLPDPPETWEREEFTMYMSDLAAEHVFRTDGSGEASAAAVRADVEAVDLGVRFEKDTILFLQEFRQLVRKGDRELVDQLVGWEKDHLVRLVRLKWELEGKARLR
jgi:rubrerythrin